jgi:hypothetical protein
MMPDGIPAFDKLHPGADGIQVQAVSEALLLKVSRKPVLHAEEKKLQDIFLVQFCELFF